MSRPFESDGTRIRVRLDSQERQLLARLFDEVAELLDDGQRLGGDPLAELVGFDLQLPDDMDPAGIDGDSCAESAPDPQHPNPYRGDPDGMDPDGKDLEAQPDGYGPVRDIEDHTAGLEDDPALARLLPSGHREDPELAAEFRRLTEMGLRARKRSSLWLASAALQRKGQLVLTREEAAALLKGLTDTRLVLGERLGLRTDEDTDMIAEVLRRRGSGDDPWVSAVLLYDVLTWWQESLISALVP